MRSRWIRRAALSLLLWTSVGIPVAISLIPSTVLAQESAKIAAQMYLDAVKTSDLARVPSVATPSMVRWTGRYLPEVFDYKVVRGELTCAEDLSYEPVQSEVAGYLEALAQAQQMIDKVTAGQGAEVKTDDLKAANERAKRHREATLRQAPCLAALLGVIGSPGLIPAEVASRPEPSASVALHTFVVDIEKRGRAGAKVTERRALVVGSFKTVNFDSGWRVVNFGMLNPRLP
jgi:hypothetical protein